MVKRRIKKGILIVEKIKIFISQFPTIKKLLFNKPLVGGRNRNGKYIFRSKGGGVSRNYRSVDFF